MIKNWFFLHEKKYTSTKAIKWVQKMKPKTGENWLASEIRVWGLMSISSNLIYHEIKLEFDTAAKGELEIVKQKEWSAMSRKF